MKPHQGIDASLAYQSAGLTLSGLIDIQTCSAPDRVALKDHDTQYTYAQLDRRTTRLAHYLADQGLCRGDRVAVLSENRLEYVELLLAAAKIGVIAACQNWRLSQTELQHCVDLVSPKLLVASPRNAQMAQAVCGDVPVVIWGAEMARDIAAQPDSKIPDPCDPEDGIVILYTSGTTGMPKGALISHRAEIARAQIQMLDLPANPEDAFVAWAPLFHMVSTDTVFKTLILGGTVIVTDGFNADELAGIIACERLGRLTLMPGMIAQVVAAVRAKGSKVKGIKWIGAMADLVPLDQIAEVTSLLNAPYLNTFGATETGLAPASGGVIEV
ncbi:MAG: AMP-binding protein, partial [Marinovum sp.]|nr:AMP-binding protein [Marinovum sp.]